MYLMILLNNLWLLTTFIFSHQKNNKEHILHFGLEDEAFFKLMTIYSKTVDNKDQNTVMQKNLKALCGKKQ